MRDRFEVHIEEPAETVLLSMSENDAAWLYSAIKDFECDPWVHSERPPFHTETHMRGVLEIASSAISAC